MPSSYLGDHGPRTTTRTDLLLEPPDYRSFALTATIHVGYTGSRHVSWAVLRIGRSVLVNSSLHIGLVYHDQLATLPVKF
jgi:hypothetical protein